MKKFFLFILIFFLTHPISDLAYSKAGKLIPFELKQGKKNTDLSPAQLNISVEKNLFEISNQTRKKKNLNTLTLNPVLLQVARGHSQDMLKRHYFSHFSPEGKEVGDRIRKLKPKFNDSYGENLHHISSAKGLNDSNAIAKQILSDWMQSPGHRKNLISPDYQLMAIGCENDGKEIFCTQVFSGPEI